MTKNTSKIPVALITGTRNGIGKYLAEYYVKQGLHVVGCSRCAIDYEFDNYSHFQLDISNESSVKDMFSEIRKKYNRLDILINNAGIASHNYALLTSINEVKKIINTNFVGTFLCSREAVKLMKNNKYGRIVNISSVHVPFATPGTSMYGASKASIEQFSRVFAKEVYQFGITINLLSLSVVKNSGMAGNLSEDRTSELLNKTISKTQIEYENISHAIDFLVSEESKMITNQNLFLGGV
jgi:3-oxoacyl-[acyl-carrier protein] reductase